MEKILITLIQCNQHWEDKKQNYITLNKLFDNINPKSQLVVIPEMFNTGFSMKTELAEKVEDSEAINWLKEKAQKYNLAIYTSFMCEENDNFYNRAVFVYPNQNLIFYDKSKLFSFAGEDKYFKGGNKNIIIEYLGWKIKLQICYELRFPEISRNFINSLNEVYYDICIYIANWPESRSLHWNSLLQARAIENQSFIIGVNRIGNDGKGLSYSGESRAISPFGIDLFNPIKYLEKIFEVELNKDELFNIRKNMNFLKDINQHS